MKFVFSSYVYNIKIIIQLLNNILIQVIKNRRKEMDKRGIETGEIILLYVSYFITK